MEENWRQEHQEEEDVPPTAGLGYEALWVEGVMLTPDRCPDCVKNGDGDCAFCEYFAPKDCPLLADAFLWRDVCTIIAIWRERRWRQWEGEERRWMLLTAVYAELRAHGRPLHFSVLTRMVQDRYPELEVTSHIVLLTMAAHPDRFVKVRQGVYRCQSG